MPVHEFEQIEMNNYLAQRLDASGEFSNVDMGYKFNGRKNPLNRQSKRHIMAVQKPEFSPTGEEARYLIIANADLDSAGMKGFCQQLALASQQGVYTAHVIYKFLQNIGDFWRRNIRDDQRTGMYTGEAAGYRKNSTTHLPDKVRNRLRKLTWLERQMAFALGGNTLMLYQPVSPRLDEKLVRFWTRKRTRRSMGSLVDMETWRDPYKSEELPDFTLTQMRRADGNTIRKRIDYHMGSDYFSRQLGDFEVLAADFLQLPALETENPNARHTLAELREAYRRDDKAMMPELEAGIRGMIEDLGGMPELEAAFGELREAHSVVEERRVQVKQAGDGMVFTLTEVPVDSGTDETRAYTVRGKANDEDESVVEWECDCRGNRRWEHCYHVDRVREAMATLESD